MQSQPIISATEVPLPPMAPRTPYAQAAGRILSKRLVGGSLPSFGLSVAFLLQLFQLTPARVLQLGAWHTFHYGESLSSINRFN